MAAITANNEVVVSVAIKKDGWMEGDRKEMKEGGGRNDIRRVVASCHMY